jgi:TonB-dependent starch-binding outer membrane protein SusC
MRLARLAWRTALLAALPAAIAGPAAAQQGATVRGTVTDSASRRGVPGAQVTVVGTSAGTVTNELGAYTLRNVPAGEATVRVQRLGYAAQDRRVTVAGGDAATADFVLRAVATTLTTVVSVGYGTTGPRRARRSRARSRPWTRRRSATPPSRRSTTRSRGRSPACR